LSEEAGAAQNQANHEQQLVVRKFSIITFTYLANLPSPTHVVQINVTISC
jgi:hypothetical protein